MTASIAQLIVGVADMAPARSLWIDRFGLEVVTESSGADKELSRIWDLPDDAIAEQLLLRTPGAAHGWLHVVRFAEPLAPVRAGAQPIDLCPKNIDVNCIAIEDRCAELEASGHTFRSSVNDYSIGDVSAREVQMPAHDDVNVVLIEVEDWPIRLSARHYGAVTSFVVVVPDTAVEAEFYKAVFGHQQLMHHRISGEAIEKTVGLPPGAALDMRLLGEPDELYGRVELITYEGLSGGNLFPAARAPATGILGCRFEVSDMDVFCERARHCGCNVKRLGQVDLLVGAGEMSVLKSPAGLAIEVLQPKQAGR